MIKSTPGRDREWTKRGCAGRIIESMQKESESLREYLSLISSLEDGGYKKAATAITDLASDIKNHLLILQGLLLEFDGGIPTSMDGIQGPLNNIKKSLQEDKKEEIKEDEED